MEQVKRIELSVHELVDFVGRSGDIDSRHARSDPDAMQEEPDFIGRYRKSRDRDTDRKLRFLWRFPKNMTENRCSLL